MTKKQPENPNVVRAKVKKMWNDFERAVYEITVVTLPKLDSVILWTYESKTPKLKDRTTNVTLWRGVDSQYKYIAFGDYVVETAHQKNMIMDAATQKHFDAYKRGAQKRLAMRERLDKIQQKVTMIRQINAKSDAIANHAKQVLIDFLATQADSLRQELGKKR